MRHHPAGFRRYQDVILRICPDQFRVCGEKLVFRCPFRDRHRNGDANWSGLALVGHNGALLVGCSGCGARWPDFVAYAGLPPTAFFPQRERERRMDDVKRVPVAEYPYLDAGGRLVAVKVRLEPGYHGRRKDFVWRRPVPPRMARFFDLDPAKPAWVNSLKAGWYGLHRRDDRGAWFGPQHDRADAKSFELPAADPGVDPGLYRLPEVLGSDPKQPVFVVESEKVVEMLRALGFVATCGHAGSSVWGEHWGRHLAGRRCVWVPDRDPSCVGVAWAEKGLASAIRWVAASVRVVMLPVEELNPDGKGGGLEDWLCRYFGLPKSLRPDLPRDRAREAVVKLAAAAPEVKVGDIFGQPAGAA